MGVVQTAIQILAFAKIKHTFSIPGKLSRYIRFSFNSMFWKNKININNIFLLKKKIDKRYLLIQHGMILLTFVEYTYLK